MNLRGIVAVSGRPGLFKLIGQNKAGYVLEGLDEQKLKIIANLANTKLASLEDITVYGEEEEIKLSDVLDAISKTKTAVPDAKADGTTLRKFFIEVAPKHDQEKVYASDMKKILAWYNQLKDLPLFTEKVEEATEAPKTEEKSEIKAKAETKAKAPKAKPTNAKAPTTKASAPAKKANMTSKKGV